MELFHFKKNRKHLSLKTVYYSVFIALVIVPVVLVLLVSLTILNQVFRTQAVENIKRAQDTVNTELKSDIEQISIRLSHMLYTNNSELLDLAILTNTTNRSSRYQNLQALNQAAGYATEPVKDVVSLAFYMKNGLHTFYKNDILTPFDEIRRESWYKKAKIKEDRVVIGSYDTNQVDLYTGGAKDSLILVAALSPGISLDSSQTVDMTALFHVTGAADKIKAYNSGYRQDKNKIGYTRIIDQSGEIVYQSSGIPGNVFGSPQYTHVFTPVDAADSTWYIESTVLSRHLTDSYWTIACLLILVLGAILTFYVIFSRYFLKRIIQPVQEISRGLKLVEEGVLDVHLVPSGQYEIRTMIHSFNAMVRRLNALISEYEEKTKSSSLAPEQCLGALIRGEITSKEAFSQSEGLMTDSYILMALTVNAERKGMEDLDHRAEKLKSTFNTMAPFASRCIMESVSPWLFIIYYRAGEEEDMDSLLSLAAKLQRFGRSAHGLCLSVCIGKKENNLLNFQDRLSEVLQLSDLTSLTGKEGILTLKNHENEYHRIISRFPVYEKLAAALSVADEKVIAQEKETLFQTIQSLSLREACMEVLSLILAVSKQFTDSGADFSHIFGQDINYFDKLCRIDDLRSLRLWITNYLSWISDYSRNRLEMSGMDIITKAKHYILEHYQESDLSLGKVAEHVDLSEKYFTTKFTKECGETFLSYVTAVRIQKAKELIKTTTFKMYEIGEMVGYNNPEHFNRIFKKSVGQSPAQYRKSQEMEK